MTPHRLLHKDSAENFIDSLSSNALLIVPVIIMCIPFFLPPFLQMASRTTNRYYEAGNFNKGLAACLGALSARLAHRGGGLSL